jgi:two-component system, chemotaxis family, protein-glutamate methylesterase/glutaminase
MFEAVVLGVSVGGMHALTTILSALPATFSLAIGIVQHSSPASDGFLAEHLNRCSMIKVKEAEDKETLSGGTAYLAPAGYHLLIEPDKSFSLSVDDKINFSRPSIDLLFESAAEAFGAALIGIVLTGANADGALGLKAVKRHGGLAIVQNPATAEASRMPRAAIDATSVDHIVDLEFIALLLRRLANGEPLGTGMAG